MTTRNIELYTKGQTPITSNARQIPENCVKIIVDSDEQGNPTVAFYDKNNNKIDIN